LIDNDIYDSTNNISSAIAALDYFKEGCYLCEADLYITNPKVIKKYQYASNILGSFSLETDDWSYRLKDGYIIDYKKGNTYCYNYYGISYWTPEDCVKLCEDWTESFKTEEGRDVFWEQIPLQLKADRYNVEVRICNKSDIMEIDNYYELQMLDSSYK
jgi:CTP:phosphocholine cytidylyltransferase-like protein